MTKEEKIKAIQALLADYIGRKVGPELAAEIKERLAANTAILDEVVEQPND